MLESSMTHPTFAPRVLTCTGDIRTVESQGGPNGCIVFVVEEPGGWYHPNKLFPPSEAPKLRLRGRQKT
jgi:hypothetical protein